jgi:hypothetical protein
LPTNVLFAFVSPQAEDPAACHAGMAVTASSSALSLNEARIEADALPVTNGEMLWAKLNAEWAEYTHIVLCAPYLDAAFLGKMVRNFPSKRFAMAYHSNLGFLAVDRFAARSLPDFLRLGMDSPNFRVASNSAEFVAAINGATGRDAVLHLPNLYHLPSATRRTRSLWAPPLSLNLGLFGAARVLKNWLTAGAAAMILQRLTGVAVYLHLSGGRDEGAEGTREGLAALLTLNPDVHAVDVPWLSADDFRRYLYGIDLLLQPSFTETFNNVTADGAFCGVPCVVSDAIGWAPDEWKAKADSADSIAAAGLRILHDPGAAKRGWAALDAHNKVSMLEWEKWLHA